MAGRAGPLDRRRSGEWAAGWDWRRCGRAPAPGGPCAAGGVMSWTRHKAVISVLAAVVLAALVAGAVLALRETGGRARIASATHAPVPPRQLLSPFTCEPVRSLNRVLAVK